MQHVHQYKNHNSYSKALKDGLTGQPDPPPAAAELRDGVNLHPVVVMCGGHFALTHLKTAKMLLT